MSGVLDGVMVIDWTQWQQAPVCSAILGDMGANVIKVEERVGGDPGRGMMRVAGAMIADDLGQRNLYFEMINRNKRSITLDLKKDKGRKIIHQLAERADVFIHNFRTGTVEKLGLDYQTLAKLNPRIIYSNCSGWGPKGPDKDATSFDFAALARSGFLSMITEPGTDLWYPQGGLADQMGAITTTVGVLGALVARNREGVGQRVDTSILGGMSFLLELNIGFWMMGSVPTTWQSRKKAGNPLWNYYRCSDGRWIAMTVLTPDPHWPVFCRVMGIEDLEKDPRFDSMASRSVNCGELIDILDGKFAAKPSQEWARLLRENDLTFSWVNTVEEFADDPQTLANDYVVDYEHPAWGKTRMPGFCVGFDRTPCSISRPAPELGQHTEEILVDVLSYSWDEVAALKEEEVI